MERSEEVKKTQHTQSLLQDILKAKFDIFFYFLKIFKFFLFLKREIHLYYFCELL